MSFLCNKNDLVLQKQIMWKDKGETREVIIYSGCKWVGEMGRVRSETLLALIWLWLLSHVTLSLIQNLNHNQKMKRQNTKAEHKKKQMNPTCTKWATWAPTQRDALKWPLNTASSIIHSEACVWRVLQIKKSKETSHFHFISWKFRGRVGIKLKQTSLGNREMSG